MPKKSFIQHIIDIDYDTTIWFYNRSVKLLPFLKGISLLGTIQFWLIFSLICFICGIFFSQSLENFSILQFLGIGISILTVSVLKRIIRRKRPYMDEKLQEYAHQEFINREPYISKKQQSFPSGHMYFWLMEIIFFYYQFGPWILIPFLVILPMIFTSRIYLGVHYLSDVIIGALMGLLFSFLCLLLFTRWILPLYLSWVAVFL